MNRPRLFLWTSLLSGAGLLLLTGAFRACAAPPSALRGPVVGHVEARLAVIGWRAPAPGTYALMCTPAQDSADSVVVRSDATAEDDLALRWRIEALRPGTLYTFEVKDAVGLALAHGRLRTAPSPGHPARVRLALGSCAASEDQPIWARMVAQRVDAIVLLGDTPYIDSTELAAARRAHQVFLAMPTLSTALRSIPLWSTWDDHDYGSDNGDGALAGKEWTRRAWLEARPQATYGHEGEGIYTRVRHGPVEVFLLDLRWFAGLEMDAHNPQARSLLGARQRTWLYEALRASDAPFKLLCGGMVWHDKGGRSQDDWASYAAERDDLFAFLGSEGIGGCVLLGGDVHACQHAIHEGTGAGYPLHEFVVSPLHARTWRGGDRSHPARRWGAVVPHVFLQVDVDTMGAEPTLTATWLDVSGRSLHTLSLRAADLGY